MNNGSRSRPRLVATLLLANACSCDESIGSRDAGRGGDTACFATDVIDSEGIDSNCDGADGVVAESVFVRESASDDGNLGTPLAPVRTIRRGLAIALASGKSQLIVGAGTYDESVELVEGVDVHGSYGQGWTTRDVDVTPTTIVFEPGPGMIGSDIVDETRISGITVSVDAEASPGASAVAVRLVRSSGVRLEDMRLVAGPGAPGAAGLPGAQPATAASGETGRASSCVGTDIGCSAVPVIARAAGGNSACGCGAGGQSGSPADDTSNSAQGGERLAGTLCEPVVAASSPGSRGAIGATPNGFAGPSGGLGTPGARGAATAFAEDGPIASSGGTGGAGGNGGGGGGGAVGDSDPFVSCTNGVLVSPSGGGGGAGGCGGPGGGGGGGGGASIPLYLWDSRPTLVEVRLEAGSAGDGGAGGPGGAGGLGGSGGPRGANTLSCSNGARPPEAGRGGDGGMGGAGGNGGGGNGGSAIALFLGGGSALSDASRDVFHRSGAPGRGGSGGTTGSDGVACSVFDASTSECRP